MKSFYTFFSLHKKTIFLVLTLIVGIFILFPTHNFITPLVQGDHGRDFYAYQQTMNGKTPYQDYMWFYGPLMPYYYASFFKIFGAYAQIALTAEIALKIMAGLVLYGILALFTTPGFSFVGATWFFAFFPKFPHTLNHAGGMIAMLACVYFVLKYIKTNGRANIPWALFSVFLLALIKLNFGIMFFIGSLGCFLSVDLIRKNFNKNLRLYIYGGLLWGAGLLGTYLFFLQELPAYYILECFPVLKMYDQREILFQDSWLSPAFYMAKEYLNILSRFWWDQLCSGLFFICLLFGIFWQPKDKNEKAEHIQNLLALACVIIFLLLALHEYLSGRRFYTKIWGQPLQTLSFLFVLGLGLKRLSPVFRAIVMVILLFGASIQTYDQHRWISALKNPAQRFALNNIDLYIVNPPGWTTTVKETVQFLNQELKPQDHFFALPYDPIYYFLTEKESPTKEFCFTDASNIPYEQEADIIKTLDNQKVDYILLSSRCDSPEPGLGTFGKTYCPLLARYVKENFALIKTFGDWTQKPDGWIDHHGTKIFKRTQKIK